MELSWSPARGERMHDPPRHNRTAIVAENMRQAAAPRAMQESMLAGLVDVCAKA
jgi:hypothetical protein